MLVVIACVETAGISEWKCDAMVVSGEMSETLIGHLKGLPLKDGSVESTGTNGRDSVVLVIKMS